jgi:hypothetical protein
MARQQRSERTFASAAEPDQSDPISAATAISEMVGEHLRRFRKFRCVETAEPFHQ